MAEQILRPDVRRLIRGVVGTLAAVSLIVFALMGLLLGEPANDPLPDKARPDHAAIRKEVDAEARERLESYGWVDRAKGIVHIPVDRAAERWLKERSEGK